MGSNLPSRMGAQCWWCRQPRTCSCGMVAGAFLKGEMGGFNEFFNDVFNSVISAWHKPACLGCISQSHLGFGASFVPPQLQTEPAVSRQSPGLFLTGIFPTKHRLFILSKRCDDFSRCTDTPLSHCSEHPTNEFP